MARIDIVRVKALCREGLFKAYIESGGIYLKDTISGEVVKLDDAPTIDPVKHGYWIDMGLSNSTGKILKCSACGGKHNPNAKDVQLGRTKERLDYCPSCGCKMDGDVQ